MSSSLQGKLGILAPTTVTPFSSRFAMTMLISMVFLGAFLLFSMEPLVGRLLVPYFGGAIHVWLICLMFFQAMLLVGYLYAHLLARKLGAWHLLLLLLPLINLPLGVVAEPSPHAPVATLLGVLAARFALPFAVLATTAVVAQVWLATSTLRQDNNPYPLYAASNAGSLLALLGYPFLVEPLSGIRIQSHFWTAGYVVYCLLALVAWFAVQPGKRSLVAGEEKQEVLTQASPTVSYYARWLLLSALPSAFLLSITNFIALEVGSFPMIWVLPLALYLGSFIITFRTRGGVPESLGKFWPHLLFICLMIYLLPINSVGWGMIIFSTVPFFAICLIAHGTLYELRPAVDHLTVYYLLIAVGGLIGGISISLIAPVIFSGLYEYPLLLAAFAISFAWLSPAPLYFWRKTSSPIMYWGNMAIIVCFLSTLLIYSILFFTNYWSECKFRHRNFYGTYRVIDVPASGKNPESLRELVHGMTLHGAQLLAKDKKEIPITYYHHGGPIADVYEVVPSPRRLAVVGLGAGVLSSFTRPGDSLTYYEIDPDNEKIARDWFTFLSRSKAPVSVVVGDGRLSLQNLQRGTGQYDVIFIDAFTGDGIPAHLLTLEAMRIYLSHLADDGLLLFHISNRYYDLLPLMKAMGRQLKLSGLRNIPLKKAAIGEYDRPAICAVFSRKAENLLPLIQCGWVPFSDHDGIAPSEPWTDDYINILSPLLARFKVQ